MKTKALDSEAPHDHVDSEALNSNDSHDSKALNSDALNSKDSYNLRTLNSEPKILRSKDS